MTHTTTSRPTALTRIATAASLLLLACSLLYTSCRKPGVEEQQPKAVKKTVSAPMVLKMNMTDVVARLPQTIMYSLGSKAKFYTDRAQWQYTDKGLLVRIPTTEGRNKYIYALKRYDKPEAIDVYTVQFTPDDPNKENAYSGKMLWLDLQDGNLYRITYKEGRVVGYMQPQQLFPACLESSMLERGYFYLNGDQLVVRDDDDPKILMRGGPLDCPDNVNGSSKSLWETLGDWFTNTFSEINKAPYTGPDGSVGSGGLGSGGDLSGPGSPNGDGYSDAGGGWNDDSNDPGNNGPFGPNLPSGSLQVNYVGSSLGLDQAHRDWLEQHLSICTDIMQFLIDPSPSLTMNQKLEIAQRHLQMMLTNPGYLDFVNNYDQNYPIGKSILELADYTFTPGAATNPITNLTEYLKCFANTFGATYKVTLAVDQPVPNTRKTFAFDGGIKVGHTFLILEQHLNGITTIRSIGLYPIGNTTPFNPENPGVYNNDQNHSYDVALVNNINGINFMNIVNAIKSEPNPVYNLNNHNCTTFALYMLYNRPMLNIPWTLGGWTLGMGYNPGDLGEDIRPGHIILNSYQTSLNAGNAPQNIGTCP